jgi:diaminopimelate epimerase
MCGNGARCICHFARLLGIVGDTMEVETDAGTVYGWYLGGEIYRIRLNLPGIVDLNRTENAAYVELGNPGVPHSVTEVPGLVWEDRDKLREMAKSLRHHSAFPKGANANLYTWLDDTTIRILTYERGVENFTLACGTGCASSGVVLHQFWGFPEKISMICRGGTEIGIDILKECNILKKILLTGPVREVFTGEINI